MISYLGVPFQTTRQPTSWTIIVAWHVNDGEYLSLREYDPGIYLTAQICFCFYLFSYVRTVNCLQLDLDYLTVSSDRVYYIISNPSIKQTTRNEIHQHGLR